MKNLTDKLHFKTKKKYITRAVHTKGNTPKRILTHWKHFGLMHWFSLKQQIELSVRSNYSMVSNS